MRYVNGAMDAESVSNPNHLRTLNHVLEVTWVAETRDLVIKVINAPEWLVSESDKMEMIYYLTNEDFANEHFAMVWLVKKVLKLANTADAYGGD